ncbi:hypothetical protein [Alkalihalobacterium alkalinitrilicum]|uniref:hypothetical protein n=1 Tax=Alkalihalobacterium alkalinitrilicum TaxID=427920 RepID=UPI0009950212|nr:hypothetical protein [Alkalihalobacterium alkalinitrilicum]
MTVFEESCVPENMIEGYRLLYEIETTLQSIINFQLTYKYGLHWRSILYEKRPINDACLHELVSYLFKYPHIIPNINRSQREKLRKLSDIRNKVCHMTDIADSELKVIKECNNMIKGFSYEISSKR